LIHIDIITIDIGTTHRQSPPDYAPPNIDSSRVL